LSARACRRLAHALSQIVHRNRRQNILTDRSARAYLFIAANRSDGALDSAEFVSLRELSSAPPAAGSRSARSGKSSTGSRWRVAFSFQPVAACTRRHVLVVPSGFEQHRRRKR
jgi:hypothetical protein